MRRFLLAAVIAGLIGPIGAGAQQRPPAPVDTAARVRITLASSFRQSPFTTRAQRIQGTLRAIAPDTLYLELPNVTGTLAIPRAQVRGVERSLGVSRCASALKIGTLGAVIFGARTLIAHQDPESRRFDEPWQAVAVGAGVGFGVGAYIGSRLPRERWREVRLPENSVVGR